MSVTVDSVSMNSVDLTQTMDRDCSALGGLFQHIISDMKGSSPLWEEFITRASKLHSVLRTTVGAVAAFFDTFQKLADVAANSRGATREMGASLTRLCMRHRNIEGQLKALVAALLEGLITPMHDKTDDWKRTVTQLDKEHAKNYKRAKADVKKASSETLRLKKKSKKGKGKSNNSTSSKLESAMTELNGKYGKLEEIQSQSVRQALTEERGRFCFLVTCLKPVIDQEVAMMHEITHLQEILQDLYQQSTEPDSLPAASEQVIADIGSGLSSQFNYQSPPDSPSSSRSRTSSVCSGNSSASSPASPSSNSTAEPPNSYRRSLSQTRNSVNNHEKPRAPPVPNNNTATDNKKQKAEDEEQDPDMPKFEIKRAKRPSRGAILRSPTVKEVQPHRNSSPVPSVAASLQSCPPNFMDERPHTISSGTGKTPTRPALTQQSFEAPDPGQYMSLPRGALGPGASSRTSIQSQPVMTISQRPHSELRMPAVGPKPKVKPVPPPRIPGFERPATTIFSGSHEPTDYMNTAELAAMRRQQVSSASPPPTGMVQTSDSDATTPVNGSTTGYVYPDTPDGGETPKGAQINKPTSPPRPAAPPDLRNKFAVDAVRRHGEDSKARDVREKEREMERQVLRERQLELIKQQQRLQVAAEDDVSEHDLEIERQQKLRKSMLHQELNLKQQQVVQLQRQQKPPQQRQVPPPAPKQPTTHQGVLGAALNSQLLKVQAKQQQQQAPPTMAKPAVNQTKKQQEEAEEQKRIERKLARGQAELEALKRAREDRERAEERERLARQEEEERIQREMQERHQQLEQLQQLQQLQLQQQQLKEQIERAQKNKETKSSSELAKAIRVLQDSTVVLEQSLPTVEESQAGTGEAVRSPAASSGYGTSVGSTGSQEAVSPVTPTVPKQSFVVQSQAKQSGPPQVGRKPPRRSATMSSGDGPSFESFVQSLNPTPDKSSPARTLEKASPARTPPPRPPSPPQPYTGPLPDKRISAPVERRTPSVTSPTSSGAAMTTAQKRMTLPASVGRRRPWEGGKGPNSPKSPTGLTVQVARKSSITKTTPSPSPSSKTAPSGIPRPHKSPPPSDRPRTLPKPAQPPRPAASMSPTSATAAAIAAGGHRPQRPPPPKLGTAALHTQHAADGSDVPAVERPPPPVILREIKQGVTLKTKAGNSVHMNFAQQQQQQLQQQ